MATLLHHTLFESAAARPERIALTHPHGSMTYAELAGAARQVAAGLLDRGLPPTGRVAFYLPKRAETVATIFGTLLAGGVFVPINPLLKAEQVAHVLKDSGARVLVTTASRYRELEDAIAGCTDLDVVVLLDRDGAADTDTGGSRRPTVDWADFCSSPAAPRGHRRIDADIAAILYTSGSTGKPKGVVLSHRNVLLGAFSVAEYLEITAEDRILAVLPFSFDYGFNQMSTAFLTGAQLVLCDYLLPRDVIKAVVEHRITGLAGVPPLWIQLAAQKWPEAAANSVRYITNSGGAMPSATLGTLRRKLPSTRVFLMYGLTEAFRSTYLPPDEIDRRPGSMGKAIPNAEVMVVRPDGTPCDANEPGELVHRGSLVSLGYWNDPARTAERFKPAPGQPAGLPLTELAVWSGDTVTRDEDGFLYFVARRDEMIKTSGYRVSPTEIEEVLLAAEAVTEVVALGVPHPTLGQAIAVVAVPYEGREGDTDKLLAECKRRLPGYMVPTHVAWRTAIPRNPNGKMDRKALADELARELGTSE